MVVRMRRVSWEGRRSWSRSWSSETVVSAERGSASVGGRLRPGKDVNRTLTVCWAIAMDSMSVFPTNSVEKVESCCDQSCCGRLVVVAE